MLKSRQKKNSQKIKKKLDKEGIVVDEVDYQDVELESD
jgi:hypothetical protein